MVCALLGLLSPANRGGLLTSLLLIFVFMGSFAGFASARVYKLLNGKDWKKCTMLAATLYPGIIGIIFLFINGFVTLQGSSTTAPIGTIISVLFLWFGVSTPLVFIGSYFGFKKEVISTPVRTNQIARHIPDQIWYTSPLFSIILGGVLPFGAVCIELFFIMSAMWLHQVSSYNIYSMYMQYLLLF
jgi:transmembrane 9 superfamily protein 2/4